MLLLQFFFTFSIHATVSAREITSVSTHKKTSCCLSFPNPQFIFCKQEAQSNQFQSGFSALDLNPFMTSAKRIKISGKGRKRTPDIVIFSDEQTDVFQRGIHTPKLLAN